MQAIENRTAVITGAASGTGLLVKAVRNRRSELDEIAEQLLAADREERFRLLTDADLDDATQDHTTIILTGGGPQPGPATPRLHR